MIRKWTTEEVMTIIKGFQPACVLFAAADLDVFTLLKAKTMTSQALSIKLETDPGATTILLDALVAMELLNKKNNQYSVPSEIAELFTEDSLKNILPGVRHQANCLRRWVQLPQVIKRGEPAEHSPSIRGENADRAAFIGAMDNFSAPVVSQVINELEPLTFHHLLDIGGASGTWTIAFLRKVTKAKAILFDLPEVIPIAEKHIAEAGLTGRVAFVKGDFYTDDIPKGADFVWLSAIVHQNARKQNQELFSKIYSSLETGGVLVLRDVVMDQSRTKPEAGALFAINMLVATEGGGTYTFDELHTALLNAGFTNVTLICRDEFMNSLIRATKGR